MKAKTWILSALLTFSIVGCGHKRVDFSPDGGTVSNAETKEAVVSHLYWVKNKADSIDIYMQLHNKYAHPVHLKAGSFNVMFEGRAGSRRKNDLALELGPNEMANGLLIYEFAPVIAEQGKVVFTIDPIYADAEGKKKLPAIKHEVVFK